MVKRVIALFGQKGGSGKTTLAVHLAVAAQADGEAVLIIDTDPQESALAWGQCRAGKPPGVVAHSSDEVSEVVAKAPPLTLFIVDCAPHATLGAAAAIREANLVLLPCRPTAFDLRAIVSTVSITEAMKKPAAFVLNGCPLRAPEIAEAKAFLSSSYPYIPLIPTTIGDRRPYMRAVASGRAVTEFDAKSVAADEVRSLWKWVKYRLESPPREGP